MPSGIYTRTATMNFSNCGKYKRTKKHLNSGNFKKGNIPWIKGKAGHPLIIGKNGGENHPNWKGGISFKPYPLGWNKTFREQIRYRDGYKCQVCGVPEIECKLKLAVHHIDYNKNNLNPKNLITLCISCHIKTNYNRNYWKEVFNEY